MVRPLAANETECMGQELRHGVQTVGGALRRSRKREHERAPAYAGDLPREVGGGKIPPRVGAHFLRKAGGLDVEDAADSFGGSIARRDTGSSGQEDQVHATLIR